MAASYTLIATSNVTSAVNNITFSSISSDYTDLVLHYTAIKLDNASGIGNASFYLQANGVTSSVYASRGIRTTPSPAVSGFSSTGASGELTWSADSTSNTFGTTGLLNIFNYRSTTRNKVAVGHAGNSPQGQGFDAVETWLFNSTAAITELKFYPQRNNFISGTVVHLYGILAA